MTIDGLLSSCGEAGGDGGAGGDAVYAQDRAGGGGGGGVVYMFYTRTGSISGSVDVSGGAGGSGYENGSPGTAGTYMIKKIM
mgnify:CR=1 FL=1